MSSADCIERHGPMDWSDFRQVITQGLRGQGPLAGMRQQIFRGQRSERWPLEASYDRRLRLNGRPFRKSDYDALIARFIFDIEQSGQAREYFPLHRTERNPELVATILGQHHGLPTRLLDWSRSPYVAAFFAFEASLGRDPDDCAVFALDRRTFAATVDEDNCRIVEEAFAATTRVPMQQGLFTHNKSIHGDLEDLLRAACARPNAATSGTVLRKFVLARTDAATALHDLALMGISHARLFPGVDGICRSLAADL